MSDTSLSSAPVREFERRSALATFSAPSSSGASASLRRESIQEGGDRK